MSFRVTPPPQSNFLPALAALGGSPRLMPVEQGLPWHPVAAGLPGRVIPCVVAVSHLHALLCPVPRARAYPRRGRLRARVRPPPSLSI